MKRLIASAGLVALGATGLQAQDTTELSRLETTKPWSVSAALRGFYDDNYLQAPSHNPSSDEDSFGIELRPSVGVNLFPQDQTFVSASYSYSAKWYESRPAHSVDHQHEVNAKLDHRFNERYKISATDSFVYAREPELLSGNGPITTFQRQNFDVFRNTAAVELGVQATETLGAAFGYQNSYYDFVDDGTGRLSAYLDRLEHLIRADARYNFRPDLVGILGYQFGINDFTSEDAIVDAPPVIIRGDDRDSTSHFVYVGGEYALSKRLSASARIGAQFTDYSEFDQSEWSPYVTGSVTYHLLRGTTMQVGVRHERNATDQGQFNGDSVTLDQESTLFFGNLSHKITPRITGSLLAQYQRSVFNGGSLDGDVDNFFMAGLNVAYAINKNFSAEAGYNYDRLDSDLGSAVRSFTRNRVYVGVRATY